LFVIFSGEELTAFGFVREEYEKTLRTSDLDTTISLMWCDAYAPRFRICKVSDKSWKSLVG